MTARFRWVVKSLLLSALLAFAANAAIMSDFDGDGHADILWRNAVTGANYFYPMNGTTILPAEGSVRAVADLNWKMVAFGDFNGDGKADIFWRNTSTGENYVYLMNGTSIIGEGYVRTVADQNWQVAGVGDFNGDGKADILWRNSSTGENYVYLMNGTTIVGEGYLRTVADQNWRVVGVGDLNGGGKADILWRNSSTGENYVYLMSGTTIVGEGSLRTVADQNWSVAGVADFDGDGRADILWRNGATGENYLYPMNGTTILAGEGYLRTVADLTWHIAAVGDYNGDGRSDILWRNVTSGNNYIYFLSGTSIIGEGYVRTVADQNWSVMSAVADTTLPTWVNALAIGQWYEIPNTKLSSADPSPIPPGASGPSSKIDAWTSLAVDYVNSKVYQVAGGGHTDYAGNEVNVLTLNTQTPGWSQVLAPTPAASVQTGPYYVDGRPTSRHHYYGIVFVQQVNRVMLFSGSQWENGWFTNKVDSYNIASNTYSAAGTHPNIPQPLDDAITTNGGLPSVTLDPSTGDVYLSVNNNSAVWRRSTNAWAPLSGGVNGFYSMSAFDTTRNRFLVLSDVDHHIYTPGAGWSSVTITGANAINVLVRNSAMFYVPALDAYLVRQGNAGGTIYKVNAATFEATTFATTGGSSVPSNLNGPFNKFVYLPKLKGAVYVPIYDGNAWFVRLH
jgi:hypothetical protein